MRTPPMLGSLILAALVAGCVSEQPVRRLAQCWNVNQLKLGPVQGNGVFTTSYEGMSLQAPSCDDRGGRNRFELVGAADETVRYFRDPASPRYLGFAFVGQVVGSNEGNVLLIKKIQGLQGVEQPKWISVMMHPRTRDQRRTPPESAIQISR